MHDVFISHASEDKDPFVRDLARRLQTVGLDVWYDEFSLRVGDSLAESIDRGLAHSRYGLVVLSPNFFAKHWTRWELNGLVARQAGGGESAILPIWHQVSHKAVVEYSPSLADLVALNSAVGNDELVRKLVERIKPSLTKEQQRLDWQRQLREWHPRESLLSTALGRVFDEYANDWSLKLVDGEHFDVNFTGHVEIELSPYGPWWGEIVVIYEPEKREARPDDWKYDHDIDKFYFRRLQDFLFTIEEGLKINFADAAQWNLDNVPGCQIPEPPPRFDT